MKQKKPMHYDALTYMFLLFGFHNLHVFQDHLAAPVKPQHAAVQRKVVAPGIPPFFVGVVIIIICPLLIRLLDHISRFFLCQAISLDNVLDPELFLRMDEHLDAVGVLL